MIRPAGKAWVGLTIYVLAADAYLIHKETNGIEGFTTMSTAFEDALRHPIKRWAVAGTWGLLTAHLFDMWIPERYKRYEPISVIGSRVGKILIDRRRDGDLLVTVTEISYEDDVASG